MEELRIGIPVWLTSDQRKEDTLLKLRLAGMCAPGLEEPWAAPAKAEEADTWSDGRLYSDSGDLPFSGLWNW